MIRWQVVLVALVAVLGSSPGRVAADDQEKTKLRLLVPAYFYPAGQGLKEWQKMMDAAADVPVVAIVNPASGPGQKIDDNYRDVVAKARKAKVTLIGYVSTSYGKRSLDEVKTDIDRWVEFYPQVQGFFFDEQPSGKEHVDHYAALAEHARKKIDKALLIANPGTVCAEEYLTRATADVFCVFENLKGFDDFKLPAWAEKVSPERFAALPYNVAKAEQMREHVKASAKRFGHLYVTDDSGNNPWDRLPGYWTEEVEAVKRSNGQPRPNP
jgi:hypothetical protein